MAYIQVPTFGGRTVGGAFLEAVLLGGPATNIETYPYIWHEPILVLCSAGALWVL